MSEQQDLVPVKRTHSEAFEQAADNDRGDDFETIACEEEKTAEASAEMRDEMAAE